MSAAPVSLLALRHLLSDRFPQAVRASAGSWTTGIAELDRPAGGLPRHALTEIVRDQASGGSQLLISQLLAASRAIPARAALVDGADQFEPAAIPAAELEHLLWVRCRQPGEAIPVADILARESGFDLVVLDLVAAPLAMLRRIAATAWYRLQRAVEQTDLALVVFTPAPLVPCAQLRLRLESTFRLEALEAERPELAGSIRVSVLRQRLAASA